MSIKDCPIYFLPDYHCGRGHVMRLTAIEEACRDLGFHETIWIDPKSLVGGFYLPEVNDSIIFIDHYYVNKSDVALFSAKSLRNTFVIFDDFAKVTFGDIVVRPHFGNRAVNVSHLWCLAGPDYFPLCKDVIDQRSWTALHKRSGIYDPANDPRYADRKIPRREILNNIIAAAAFVTPPSVMAYEAMYLGTPLLLTLVADNQLIGYRSLIQGGYAVPDSPYERWSFEQDKDIRDRYSNKGQGLVDGRGAARIVQTTLKHAFHKWGAELPPIITY